MTMTLLNAIPEHHEAPEYYFKYIHLVPQVDIRSVLSSQLPDMVTLFESIPEDTGQHRYAPDRWSIRQVVAHLNDTERLFAFRAFWFARGFAESLPSFDQNVAAAHNPADERPWRSLVDEFREIRASTLTFFRYLPPEVWMRRGRASGYEFTCGRLRTSSPATSFITRPSSENDISRPDAPRALKPRIHG